MQRTKLQRAVELNMPYNNWLGRCRLMPRPVTKSVHERGGHGSSAAGIRAFQASQLTTVTYIRYQYQHVKPGGGKWGNEDCRSVAPTPFLCCKVLARISGSAPQPQHPALGPHELTSFLTSPKERGWTAADAMREPCSSLPGHVCKSLVVRHL
jgi:hypothetical protein